MSTKLKIPLDLPNTDLRAQPLLKHLLYVHLFSTDITTQELCDRAGIQPKQLYRAWHGSSTYRSQQATALTLIAHLPYQVSDELISITNDVIDLIAKTNLDAFKVDGETYD
ncbi:hypothetical protein CN457_27790 [Bacillus cereus]|nr:hypothetical protein CN457_27790 [Bacillus cereus]